MEFDASLCECGYCTNEKCCKYFKERYKAGIKEVVDWIENNGFKVDGRPILIPNDVIGMTCVFIPDEKLKEWGIDNEK
jgi:hypothetical protein